MALIIGDCSQLYGQQSTFKFFAPTTQNILKPNNYFLFALWTFID